MTVKNSIVCSLASCFLGVQALAIPLTYEVSSPAGSVIANDSDPGLKLKTQILSSPGIFTLDDDQSFTFRFFKIWTTESSLNPDDKVAKPITAHLTFAVPNVSSTVNGFTYGESTLLGFYQFGVVRWSGPDVITVDDRTFSVALSDVTFSKGLFGLSAGRGGTVSATVTQLESYNRIVSSSVPVPDTASALSLLGFGLLGVNWLRRKLSV
jgi:hypothetical protein